MKKSVLPKELVKEIKTSDCILFIGSGVTTEHYYKHTFLEHVKKECNYPKKIKNQSFPDVMQYYCQTLDGNRKNKLIREIIEWIVPFSAEGEPNRSATDFLREIARIPFFRTIVTTNWDPFCERTMNVLVPMVEDQDIPFWDDSDRHVLKIHGCVTRPHTIVATLEDYDKCMKDKSRGAIFTKLRDLMATKTFVFVGYSANDLDFKFIYDEIIDNLGSFRRSAYVVDPKPTEDSIKDWETRSVKIIKMSGLVFARELNKDLEQDKLIPSEELIDHFEKQLYRIIDIHVRTSDKQEVIGGFSSSMYQDGLIHSLEHLITGSRTGISMKDIIEQLNDHEKTLANYWKAMIRNEKKPHSNKPNYDAVEVAYWSGRVIALKHFVSHNKKDIPAFFSPYILKPRSKMASLN